jgi:hypothetical protein
MISLSWPTEIQMSKPSNFDEWTIFKEEEKKFTN